MKVGLLDSPGHLAVVDRPSPTAGPGEIVVELAACGVCGTDLEKLRGNYQRAGKLGHEPVGRVVDVGAGVPDLAPGDRVFVHHHVPCLACEVCKRGDPTFCPEYGRTNIDPGGFSERFRVPSENVSRGAVLRLDPSVDWATGTLLEPAACARTALRRVGFQPGDRVFIVGLGPVGLLYARLASAMGAGWVGGAELSPRRRAAAIAGGAACAVDPLDSGAAERAVQAATGGQGVDLAVVATGATAAVRLAAGLARRAGTLNLFGLPEAGSQLPADLQELYLRGVKVVPTYATTERDIRDVHDLLVSGRLDLSGLVTHTIPLASLADAFALAGHPEGALKVAVTGPAFGVP
ncbi:MAG TPA: alcohol dehydrogenase catalytic domain-containing protein [Thermoplasmata archaeon]|nr:alcohol dehydrogenase catalytic domain-containing protein [Thermoplasmata archaeon]